MTIACRRSRRRGVAQPGRAPGSGPGGRRFKSSLPDQSFQTLKQHFWFSVYIDGVEIVDGAVFLDFRLGFHRELQSDILQELGLPRDCSSRLTADQPSIDKSTHQRPYPSDAMCEECASF